MSKQEKLTIKVTDQKGKKVKDLTLDPNVFGVPLSIDLLAQYVRVYQSNQRQGTACTKTRGEVRGGGKKPWRQKGTGRARHGSTRSPIWVGGGTAHGPKPRDWSLKLFKKMSKKALATALSNCVVESQLSVVDKLEVKSLKTADMLSILEALSLAGKKVLIVLDTLDKSVITSCGNISTVSVIQAVDLNAYNVLGVDVLLITEKGIKVLEGRLVKKGE